MSDTSVVMFNEVDSNKLFKNGCLTKLGNYSIGADVFCYGIHIPTSSREEAESIMKQILDNQILMNRIKMIIKDKENEIEYVEKQYPNIESESHNLHHEWKAKLDDVDMFKRLLL